MTLPEDSFYFVGSKIHEELRKLMLLACDANTKPSFEGKWNELSAAYRELEMTPALKLTSSYNHKVFFLELLIRTYPNEFKKINQEATELVFGGLKVDDLVKNEDGEDRLLVWKEISENGNLRLAFKNRGGVVTVREIRD